MKIWDWFVFLMLIVAGIGAWWALGLRKPSNTISHEKLQGSVTVKMKITQTFPVYEANCRDHAIVRG